MRTFNDIFEAFETTQAAADCMEVPRQTAGMMRIRGRIESRYWRRLIRNAPKFGVTGITPEMLMAAEEQVTRERARAS